MQQRTMATKDDIAMRTSMSGTDKVEMKDNRDLACSEMGRKWIGR